MKKSLKIFLSLAIVVGILLLCALLWKGRSGSGHELYLNLRSGMSKDTVRSVLDTSFLSLEELKEKFPDNKWIGFDIDMYLSKVDDVVVTPDLEPQFNTEYAVVPVLGERAALTAKFFRDQLYSIQAAVTVFSEKDALEKADVIRKEVKGKYPSANEETTPTTPGAYSLKWERPPVKAMMWVNPKEQILNLDYWDHSLFKEEIKKQKSKTDGGF